MYSRDPNKRTGTAIFLGLIFHPVRLLIFNILWIQNSPEKALAFNMKHLYCKKTFYKLNKIGAIQIFFSNEEIPTHLPNILFAGTLICWRALFIKK